jgi:hypothetical protein
MARSRNTADTQTASGGPVSPFIAGKNAIINGGFDIAQRGTSGTFTTTAKSFCFDRWFVPSATSMSVAYSQQASTIAGTRYCARIQRTSGNTNTSTIAITQDIETSNSIIYAGQTVTISFYARAGSNYSSASSALGHYLIQGTGTDQSDYSAGMTGRTVASSGTATLTTTWQRFTYTATLASTTTELSLQVYYVPVGTAGTNDYFEITGVQLEQGSTATPFSRAGGTIQGELAACQRYYFLKASGSGQSFGMAAYNSSSDVRGSFGFPVEMRIVPTMVSTSGTNYYRIAGTSDYFDSLTLWQASTKETAWYNVSQASGTTGQGGVVWTDNASSSIALSAEL